MMPHLEQDQVAVLNPFDPWIRRNVSGDAIWNHRFEVAEPRAEIDNPSARISPDTGGNLAIEPAIDRSQPRFLSQFLRFWWISMLCCSSGVLMSFKGVWLGATRSVRSQDFVRTGATRVTAESAHDGVIVRRPVMVLRRKWR